MGLTKMPPGDYRLEDFHHLMFNLPDPSLQLGKQLDVKHVKDALVFTLPITVLLTHPVSMCRWKESNLPGPKTPVLQTGHPP